MSRILATNGTTERLMGVKELEQNPSWWAVGSKPKSEGAVPAQPKKVTPKEVKGPPAEDATDPSEDEASKEPANAEETATTSVEKVAAAAIVGKSIPEMVKAIKAAKTADEVKALIAGDDRDTVKKVAEQRIKAIGK